jgi:hypothetical protein
VLGFILAQLLFSTKSCWKVLARGIL